MNRLLKSQYSALEFARKPVAYKDCPDGVWEMLVALERAGYCSETCIGDHRAYVTNIAGIDALEELKQLEQQAANERAEKRAEKQGDQMFQIILALITIVGTVLLTHYFPAILSWLKSSP